MSEVSFAAEVSRVRGQEFSQAVVRANASGWAAKEVESLVDFYTDDAILFPPKGEPVRGRDAIRAYWSRTPNHGRPPTHASVPLMNLAYTGG